MRCTGIHGNKVAQAGTELSRLVTKDYVVDPGCVYIPVYVAFLFPRWIRKGGLRNVQARVRVVGTLQDRRTGIVIFREKAHNLLVLVPQQTGMLQRIQGSMARWTVGVWRAVHVDIHATGQDLKAAPLPCSLGKARQQKRPEKAAKRLQANQMYRAASHTGLDERTASWDTFLGAHSRTDRWNTLNLTLFAWLSLGVAIACALVIAVDEVRHPQRMAVMNVVWPMTALYFSVFAVWAYFSVGRRQAGGKEGQGGGMHEKMEMQHQAPSPVQVALGTSHCGAGCTLADLVTEFGIAAAGLVWFGSMLATDYLLDFLAAWALGIVFQYFAIKPMRPEMSATGAIWAAIKADTLSILAFQIGMYLWMALVYFKFFPAPHHLTPFDPRYWLMMQIAMVCGFATSYPMNRLLIGLGWKEAM